MFALRLMQVIGLAFSHELPFALDAQRGALTVVVDETPILVKPMNDELWDATELVERLGLVS